jgi:hypothetical protein
MSVQKIAFWSSADRFEPLATAVLRATVGIFSF